MAEAPACPFPALAGSWPVFAGYQVRRLLGTGGVGAVFAAVHPRQSGEVALKLIDPTRSGLARVRLLAEARAAAAVVHPRLVPSLDLGESEGVLFLVMPLIPGGDGDAFLQVHRGRIPRSALLEIASDAAEALGALHRGGILHRDVKPSNLIRDHDGHWMLTDFGLAQIADGAPGITRAGYTVGTPDYMSPEQARGEDLDGRADLYALGSTLYHLAVGHPPHSGATMWAVIGHSLTEPFPDPLTNRPDLGAHVAAVIRKLGAKRRDERYADAGQVADDLALVAAGRAPVHAAYRSPDELIASPSRPAGSPEIILIDDDPLVRRIYAQALTSRGLHCQIAASGAAGLALVAAQRPAAALVDLAMHDIAGLELVRRLRELAPDLPIVAMANAFVDEQAAALRALGITRVLTKSQTSPQVLADALASLVALGARVPALPPTDPAEALAAADAALARVQVLMRRLGVRSEAGAIFAEVAAAARGLSAAASAAGVAAAANLAAAIEALSRQLIAAPDRRSESTRATLVQAAATLRRLLVAPAQPHPPARVLAVDDERASLILAEQALAKVGLLHEGTTDPLAALERIRAGGIDLLVTDVAMDGLSGMQLAARARQIPGHERLPVMFVTGLDDFQAFFATGAGTGTDLIAKPYLLIELGLKALVLLAERQA